MQPYSDENTRLVIRDGEQEITHVAATNQAKHAVLKDLSEARILFHASGELNQRIKDVDDMMIEIPFPERPQHANLIEAENWGKAILTGMNERYRERVNKVEALVDCLNRHYDINRGE